MVKTLSQLCLKELPATQLPATQLPADMTESIYYRCDRSTFLVYILLNPTSRSSANILLSVVTGTDEDQGCMRPNN